MTYASLFGLFPATCHRPVLFYAVASIFLQLHTSSL